MIGPACPVCGHVGHPTIAVGRFHPRTPTRYRAAWHHRYNPAPIRDTRAEAEADQCAWQAGRRG